MAYGKKVQKTSEENIDEVGLTIDETVEAESVKTEKEVKQVPQKKKQIDRNMEVECRNVRVGTLTYLNKNGFQADWNDYGDSVWLEVGELMTMKASQPRFLTEPWLIVEDEDVAIHLGLKQIYDKLIPVEDIESFLLSGADNIKAKLEVAPKGAKELVRDKAREMVSDGRLDSLSTIKMLEKELQTDFEIFQK